MLINQIKQLTKDGANVTSSGNDDEFELRNLVTLGNKDQRKSHKAERLNKCMVRLRNILQLEKQFGLEHSILPKSVADMIPPQQQSEIRDKSLDISVFCQLSNENTYDKIMEEALLFDHFYRDKYQQRQQLNQSGDQSMARHDLQRFVRIFEEKQIRLKESDIGHISHKKSKVYEHPDVVKRAMSQGRQIRIRAITEKVNKHKIQQVKTFLQNDINVKRQDNCDIIDYLVQYNPANIPNHIQDVVLPPKVVEKMLGYDQRSVLQKVFFKYSNQTDPDTEIAYKYMNLASVSQFVKEVEISIPLKLMKSVYNRCLKEQNTNQINHKLSFKGFLGFLDQLSIILYDNTQDELTESDQFKFDEHDLEMEQRLRQMQQKECMNQFYKQMIFPQIERLLDPMDYQLYNCTCLREFNDRFEPMTRQLYKCASQQSNVGEHQTMIRFDQIVDFFMKIKLYPKRMTKSRIRYYYYYCLRTEEGLNFNDFQQFINQIALDQYRKVQLSKEQQNILNYYHYYFESKDVGSHNQLSIKLIDKIIIFYLHNEYLDIQSLIRK